MIIIVFYRSHRLEGGIIGIFLSCIFLISFVNRFELCSDTNYEFFLAFLLEFDENRGMGFDVGEEGVN